MAVTGSIQKLCGIAQPNAIYQAGHIVCRDGGSVHSGTGTDIGNCYQHFKALINGMD